MKRLHRILWGGLLAALMLAPMAAVAAQELSADEIVKKAKHMAYYQGKDGNARVKMTITDEQVAHARTNPPATTRAALRGAFLSVAREHGRDYSVDWTHLRLNDGAGRTVLCKDPFAAHDERVDRLIAAAGSPSPALPDKP